MFSDAIQTHVHEEITHHAKQEASDVAPSADILPLGQEVGEATPAVQ
jgi:hypothetical protein